MALLSHFWEVSTFTALDYGLYRGMDYFRYLSRRRLTNLVKKSTFFLVSPNLYDFIQVYFLGWHLVPKVKSMFTQHISEPDYIQQTSFLFSVLML